MKRRNLVANAYLLFYACLNNEWQPKTKDIMKRYSLNETQARVAIRHAKAIGKDVGRLFGWDPKVDHFLVVQQDDFETTDRVLDYQIRHWGEAGNATSDMVIAAEKAKLVSKGTSESVARLDRHFQRELKIVSEKVSAQVRQALPLVLQEPFS